MNRQLRAILLKSLFLTLLFPIHNLYADDVNKCLMEALKNADDSVTVGQLRKQCQKQTKAILKEQTSPNSSAVEDSNNGPKEIILKTAHAKKPAYFPHERHQQIYPCDKCHHGESPSGRLVKYTAKSIIYKCIKCHNSDMPNQELNSFQSIGHKLCRECHRKSQDMTSAKCSSCHRSNTK